MACTKREAAFFMLQQLSHMPWPEVEATVGEELASQLADLLSTAYRAQVIAEAKAGMEKAQDRYAHAFDPFTPEEESPSEAGQETESA